MDFIKECESMRFEKEVNIYAKEAILKRFQANETSMELLQGKFAVLISSSELTELENSKTTMYSKLGNMVLDINALQLNFSDLNTKYNAVTGQYSALDSKLAEYKAGVEGLSASIASVKKNISDNYSTTTAVNSAINAKANEISASVSGTYAKQTDLINANNKISSLESWKNEASFKITDEAILLAVTSSTAWGDKVNAAQIGTLIQQNPESVRIAWNHISNYLQFENGGLSIYDGSVLEDKLTTKFNEKGIHFWKDNYYLGKIGNNQLASDNSKKGIVFDLEYEGAFMAWGARKSPTANNYTTVITFANKDVEAYSWKANNLYLGCDLDINGYKIKYKDNFLYTKKLSNSDGTYGMDVVTHQFVVRVPGQNNLDNHRIAIGTDMAMYCNINMLYNKILNQSDARLKTNIVSNNEKALEKLVDMVVSSFDWRETGEHVSAGLIAQQVQEIIPEIIEENNKGILSINYIALIPYLLKAIQELYILIKPYNRATFKTENKNYDDYTEQQIQEAMEAVKPLLIEYAEPDPTRLHM